MKISKVRNVKTPERGTAKSAGIDFFVPSDFIEKVLPPQRDMLIPSGIKANVPENFMLMAAEKSGVVTSKQAAIAAGRTPKPSAYTSIVILGAKIVDEDYQGEIHIHVINVGNEYVTIKPDTKIAQFILVPVSYEDVEEVPESELFSEVSERGDGGFGSTGE
jgi:deoxyuridine 5'-triphosphate nucleotidohydrolase